MQQIKKSTDEVISALPAFICVIDANRLNVENRPLWSKEKQELSDVLLSDAKAAYFRSKVYRNFRKNFIAIKVDAPQLADKISKEVKEFDNTCIKLGVTKKETRGGFVYELR